MLRNTDKMYQSNGNLYTIHFVYAVSLLVALASLENRVVIMVEHSANDSNEADYIIVHSATHKTVCMKVRQF